MTSGGGKRIFLDTNALVFANIEEAPLHDANIVATMLAYNIPALLTNNTEDFARFAGVITFLPLQTAVA